MTDFLLELRSEEIPARMQAAARADLEKLFRKAMADAGELRIEDPLLAAEQFASMCKGMGDLERRFAFPPDPDLDRRRIDGAVEVFCLDYANECD